MYRPSIQNFSLEELNSKLTDNNPCIMAIAMTRVIVVTSAWYDEHCGSQLTSALYSSQHSASLHWLWLKQLAQQWGTCFFYSQKCYQVLPFFVKLCHFYKSWIIEKVHHTIFEILVNPNSYDLLAIVSVEIIHEVKFFISNPNNTQWVALNLNT